MAKDSLPSHEERRQYCRVEAVIPFACRPVPPEERLGVKSRLLGVTQLVGTRRLPEIADSSLAEWLSLINGKLDMIIGLLKLQKEGFEGLPLERVNLGAGGMRFHSDQRYEVGDLVEIRMILTSNETIALYVLAKVGSVTQKKGRYETAVRFLDLDEKIEEEIVRFVFEQEREILRRKKG